MRGEAVTNDGELPEYRAVPALVVRCVDGDDRWINVTF